MGGVVCGWRQEALKNKLIGFVCVRSMKGLGSALDEADASLVGVEPGGKGGRGGWTGGGAVGRGGCVGL